MNIITKQTFLISFKLQFGRCLLAKHPD